MKEVHCHPIWSILIWQQGCQLTIGQKLRNLCDSHVAGKGLLHVSVNTPMDIEWGTIDMETKLRECLKFAGENSEVARRIGKSWNDVFEKNFYEMHSFFKIDVKPRYNNPLPDVTFPEAPNEKAGESLTEDELEFINE